MRDYIKQMSFVITGATSGIGLAVAQALAVRGASVIGLGRSPARCQQAEQQLAPLRAQGARIAFTASDLSVQHEVRRAADEIRTKLNDWGLFQLDALINNAATVPYWQIITPEGFDLQWAVNHLAGFLLTNQLLPELHAAPAARVVTVSSASHYHARLEWEDLQLRRHYNPLTVYNQTKLANILFMAEFNRRQPSASRVRGFAADPGLVNTDIGLKSNSLLARRIWNIRRRGGLRPEEAAQGIVFLAADPSIRESKEIYWKSGRPKAPSAHARNPQTARQLWEVSLQMCGLAG